MNAFLKRSRSQDGSCLYLTVPRAQSFFASTLPTFLLWFGCCDTWRPLPLLPSSVRNSVSDALRLVHRKAAEGRRQGEERCSQLDSM